MTQPDPSCSSPIERSGRVVCTQADPWTPDKGRAAHPDAVSQGAQRDGWPGGDIQAYKCPWCGVFFEEELPQ